MDHFLRFAAIAGLLLFAAHAQAAATKPGATFSDCKDCPKMVVIAPGTFQMGANRSEPMRGNEDRPLGPVHKVTIGYSFAAGAYEVTNKEFGAFIKATGYKPAASCQVWGGIEVKEGKTWQDPDYGVPTTPQQPVVCVTWNDAKAYTAWLSKKTGKKYRLLSESEWEYVARAGATTTWPWGDDAKRICEFANWYDIQGRKVQGQCEKRANRGGSWRTRLSRQDPAFRGRDPEPTASNIFGFRVARDMK